MNKLVLLIFLILLPVGVEAQDARYLRCESATALIDVVGVRESLEADPDLEVPVDLVISHYLAYVPCKRITGWVEYDSVWEDEEGIVCFSAPVTYPEGVPAFEGRRCALEAEWLAAGGER